MPSDEFRLLKGLVEKIGEPYIGGVLLQVTHASAVVLCSACGPVEPRFPHGWPTDWFAQYTLDPAAGSMLK